MIAPDQVESEKQTHKKRYVICGLSNRAIGYYVPSLMHEPSTSEHNELVGILDNDQDRIRAFNAAKGSDVPGYEPNGFEQMVKELEPDGVLVTGPDYTHAEYIIKGLEHGLDVITEKPMVIDCEQARAVIEAEQRSRGTVRVTHNYRYMQAHMQIKRMIQEGLLGRITNVEFIWNLDTYHGSSYFYRWNRDRTKSGGMTITKGCHHFDLINWWLGDIPQQVFAYGALNYYGSESPYNPSNVDGKSYTVAEQKERCPYNRRWAIRGLDAPKDDHLSPRERRPSLLSSVQYPPSKPMYIYDEEIEIEDTYSAVVRYSGGASMVYSTNFSAPWEGYTLAINGTKGRLETTHYTAPSRCPFPASERQPITYYPMFGERQIHETRQVSGGHGGADPLLKQELFRGGSSESGELSLPAGSLDGAYAVAVGEAMWRSHKENRPIDISELLPIDPSRDKSRTR